MRCTDRRLLVVAGLAALLLAPAAGAAAAKPVVHTVVIDKMTFAPVRIDARPGDVVEWVNKDMFVHSATAADKAFDLELKVGARARTVVKKPGVVDYRCRYHPGMKGEIRVAP
jgi:plastocyanin